MKQRFRFQIELIQKVIWEVVPLTMLALRVLYIVSKNGCLVRGWPKLVARDMGVNSGVNSGGQLVRSTDYGSGNPFTDFGSGTPPWGSTTLGVTLGVNSFDLRIWDLPDHLPVLKKDYIGPFLAGSLFREKQNMILDVLNCDFNWLFQWNRGFDVLFQDSSWNRFWMDFGSVMSPTMVPKSNLKRLRRASKFITMFGHVPRPPKIMF